MSQKSDGSVIVEAKLALDQYKKDLADLERETNKVVNNIQTGMEKSATGAGKFQGSMDSLSLSLDAMRAAALRSVAAQERLSKVMVARSVNTQAASGMGKLAAAEALIATNATKAGLSIKTLTAGMKILLRVLTGLGPVGLATAALASALAYLFGRQKEGEQRNKEYSLTLEGVYGSAKEAAKGIDSLREKIAEMGHEERKTNLSRMEAQLVRLRQEGERFMQLDPDLTKYWGPQKIGYLDSELNKVIDAARRGIIEADAFREAVHRAYNQKFIDEKEKDKILEWGKKVLEASGTIKELTGSASGLGEAFRQVDKAFKINSAGEAVKVLLDVIGRTKEGKEAAIEHKKARAEEAIQFLRNAVAASELAANIAYLDMMEAESLGLTKKAEEARGRYTKALQEAARAAGLVSAAIKAISDPSFRWDTGSTKKDLESLSKYIVRFRKGLDDVRTSGEKTFEKGLGAGVEKLRKDLEKVKGATEDVFKSLKKELTEAHAENFLKGLQRDLEELSGRGLIDKMTGKIEDAALALEKLGPESEDAARLLRGLTLAATDNKPSLEALTAEIDAQAEALIKANPELAEYIRLLAKQAKEAAKGGEDKELQARLQFLEEYGRLSGNYGKAIELQTKLISERAAALRKEYPDLKANIDGWERLAKLEIDPSFDAGISRSAQKFTAEWTNAGKVAEKTFDTLIGGVQSIGSSAIDAVFGDAEFRIDTLFKDIAKQMMQIAMNQTIAGAMKSLFGGEDELAAIQAKTEAELASIATISAAKTAALNSESAAVATVGEQWTIAQALQELATESTVLGSAQQEMAIAGLTAASTTAVETQTAVSTSAAAETAAAWAPAATTASIGSFGAAAALALVGIMAVMALMRGFSQGGYTGNGSTSEVAGVVHGGEFVVNAAATRSIGVNNLNSLNSTGSLASLSTGRTSALSNLERPQSGGDMYVNVINNSSDSTVSQQQSMDANGNMRLDIVIDDIMAGKVVNGTTARALQSVYGLRRTVGRV